MGDRRLGWFCFGFAAALVVSALTASAHAQAQSRTNTQTYATGVSTPSRGQAADPGMDDGYAAPGIPPPVPSNDPSEFPEEQDGLDPQPRAGQRPVVQDGDITQQEPAQPVDGIIDVGEPAPPEDGTDPSTVDTRPPEDIAVFENPLPVDDPLLFQIEDLDPILDNRRTARLFTREPFDPVGIKVGSFILFPELDFGTSWYSNVLRAPNANSDIALDIVPSARLVSNWSTHALEFRAVAPTSFFKEYSSENDKGYTLEARGRLDITRRTNVQALISRDQSLESRSALDANAIGDRTQLTTDRAELALNHRFNRLSVQIRGSVADFSYGDTTVLGVSTTNDDRSYTQYEETARATWELKPTLSPFVEVAINQREHDVAAQSDLINRGSNGQRYRAGLQFGNTGKVLRGEVSLGYGVQTPDDSRLKSIDGLIVDANATWRASELTSVLFTARSDVSETTTTGVGGSMYRYLALDLRHQLHSYLIGTAGLSYATQNSQDGVIDENELRATLGVEYFLSREAVLYGRYAHTKFDAIGSTSDYSADEVHVGMRLRR